MKKHGKTSKPDKQVDSAVAEKEKTAEPEAVDAKQAVVMTYEAHKTPGKKTSLFVGSLVVLLVAVVGTILLLASHADVPSNRVLLGIYPGSTSIDSLVGAKNGAFTSAGIGRQFDLFHIYQAWPRTQYSASDVSGFQTEVNKIVNLANSQPAGRSLVVNFGSDTEASPANLGSWTKMANGGYDAGSNSILKILADGLKQVHGTIYISWSHEPEGGNVSCSKGCYPLGTQADYRNGWKKFKTTLVGKYGVDNSKVKFVPILIAQDYLKDNPGGKDAQGNPTGWYPGDDVADVMGVDGYNWACTKHNGVDNRGKHGCGSSWTQFENIFNAAAKFASSRNKPLFITEVGVAEDPDNAQHKAQWFTHMADFLKTNHTTAPWSSVKAFIYFQGAANAAEFNIHSSATTFAGFKAMGLNPVFNGGGTPPPADNQPPTVTLSPINGAPNVHDMVNLSAAASDDHGVDNVTFAYKANTATTWTNIMTDTASPYATGWDTTQVSNGIYQVRAIATDAMNSSSQPSIITVTVNNSDSTTHPPVSTGWMMVYDNEFIDKRDVTAFNSDVNKYNAKLKPSDTGNSLLSRPTIADNVQVVNDSGASDGKALAVYTRQGTYKLPDGKTATGWTNGRMAINGHNETVPIRISARIKMTPSINTKSAVMWWPAQSGWPWEVDFAETFGAPSLTDPMGAKQVVTENWHFDQNPNDKIGAKAQLPSKKITVDMTKYHTFDLYITPNHMWVTVDGVLGYETHDPHWIPNSAGFFSIGKALTGIRSGNHTTDAVYVDWLKFYKPGEVIGGPQPPSTSTPLPDPTEPADTSTLTAPSQLKTTNATAKSVPLTWTAASGGDGNIVYKVTRNGQVLDTVSGTTFNDRGVTANTTYRYKVIAVDQSNNQSETGYLTVTTPKPGAMGVIAGCKVTTSTGWQKYNPFHHKSNTCK